MVRILSTYCRLTLQTSLEAIMRLGDDYLIAQDEENWRPTYLLAWLERKHPDLLLMPVALVPPDATGEGAVFAVDPQGSRSPIPPSCTLSGADPRAEALSGRPVRLRRYR